MNPRIQQLITALGDEITYLQEQIKLLTVRVEYLETSNRNNYYQQTWPHTPPYIVTCNATKSNTTT